MHAYTHTREEDAGQMMQAGTCAKEEVSVADSPSHALVFRTTQAQVH